RRRRLLLRDRHPLDRRHGLRLARERGGPPAGVGAGGTVEPWPFSREPQSVAHVIEMAAVHGLCSGGMRSLRSPLRYLLLRRSERCVACAFFPLGCLASMLLQTHSG